VTLGGLGRVASWSLGAGVGAWLLRHVTAPAVRVWRPGGGARQRAGLLSVRVAGTGRDAVVLLHGLSGSGDAFGAAYDSLATGGRLVVPDLLGFGRSMDMERQAFGLAPHLEALDRMADTLGLDAGRLIVAGHSLGGLLALEWAARQPERIERVVTWGAPLYRNPAEARRHIEALGSMARLFALEGPRARRACAWMCEHRRAASWVAVLLHPELPVAIARQGVRHTWPAYLGGMNGVILRGGWEDAVHRLDAAGIPIVLAAGRRDRVPVAGLAEELGERYPCVRVLGHPGAGHDLPLTDPDWCVRTLTEG